MKAEGWSNDAENSALPSQKYILKQKTNNNCENNISQYYYFTIFLNK